MQQAIRVAIAGFGGLGQGMAQLIPNRPDFRWVAMANAHGYAFDANGLSLTEEQQSTQPLIPDSDALITLLQHYGSTIDAVFLALPDLPVGAFVETVKRIADETDFQGVLLDAATCTETITQLLALQGHLQARNILHIAGAGAVPGFLTAIAALAGQTFVEVLDVNIHFGLGVADWQSCESLVRGDFIHLEGLDAKQAACMSDAEISEILQSRGCFLNHAELERADDILLAMAGVCSSDRVRIGGLMDTRNETKPTNTTVTVTGRFASGAVGSHQFVLSDEAAMLDMVCAPALGYMLRGMELFRRGFAGVLTSVEVMPRFSSHSFGIHGVLNAPKLAAFK